jgi:hypothetical protein
MDAGKMRSDPLPGLQEHAQLQRDLSRAANERDATIQAIRDRYEMDRLDDRSEELGDALSDAEAALMKTPAPGLAALRLKLERLPEKDGDMPAWSSSYIAQTISLASCRREPEPCSTPPPRRLRAPLSAREVLVDVLDMLGGDPDLENATDLEDDHTLSPHALGSDEGPGCGVSDKGENAWVEWHNLRAPQKGGHMIASDNEDDELAGDETDGNGAEDDECAWFAHIRSGPGWSTSDPGGYVEGY